MTGQLPEMTYNPDPASWGSVVARPPGHAHVPAILAWTTRGPLIVIVHCIYCSKTETARPNPRLKKIPWGFTEASWAKFLQKGLDREAQESRNRNG